MIRVKNYKKHLLRQIQNPEEAAAYLNAACQGDDPSFFLCLEDIAQAIHAKKKHKRVRV